MKKVLFMTVAIICFIGSVGLASADIVRPRVSVIMAGVTANTGDANNVTTIIFATSLDGLWAGSKVFTAAGPGSSSVYASALTALSWDAPLMMVVDSEDLQAGGQVPIAVVYNEPPPTSAQSFSQALEDQHLSEPTDMLPAPTDFD